MFGRAFGVCSMFGGGGSHQTLSIKRKDCKGKVGCCALVVGPAFAVSLSRIFCSLYIVLCSSPSSSSSSRTCTFSHLAKREGRGKKRRRDDTLRGGGKGENWIKFTRKADPHFAAQEKRTKSSRFQN